MAPSEKVNHLEQKDCIGGFALIKVARVMNAEVRSHPDETG